MIAVFGNENRDSECHTEFEFLLLDVAKSRRVRHPLSERDRKAMRSHLGVRAEGELKSKDDSKLFSLKTRNRKSRRRRILGFYSGNYRLIMRCWVKERENKCDRV